MMHHHAIHATPQQRICRCRFSSSRVVAVASRRHNSGTEVSQRWLRRGGRGPGRGAGGEEGQLQVGGSIEEGRRRGGGVASQVWWGGAGDVAACLRGHMRATNDAPSGLSDPGSSKIRIRIRAG